MEWKVLAALFDREVPQTIPEKKALILENGLITGGIGLLLTIISLAVAFA